jgi:hypothetical protein
VTTDSDLVACACGCGEVFPRLDSEKRKRRFKHGHNARIYAKGTRYGSIGGRRIHVVRAERALGHALPHGAHVHHADGSKSDTAPLVICQDQAYHRLLHVRTKTVKAGGNPNTEKLCGDCHTVKPFAAFTVMRADLSNGRRPICRDCAHIRESKRAPRPRPRLNRKTGLPMK